MDCFLKEMIADEELQNLEIFQVWLSEDIIGRITSIPPPYPSTSTNNIAWVRTSSGFFSIKSAYRMVKESSWNPREEVWKLPWKNQHNFVMGNFVWSCFFGIVTWCIWKNKNTCIFQGFPWSAEEIIKGRFLRDHNGNWILGFNRRLESCSVFEVELWDILDGVALVQGRQHDRILVQIDNMEVIRAIKKAWSKRSNSK
ncbi:hypothetical protein Goshw_026656 [Gossypium schwendimanii]|uniref:RNase H type-1 domain-containing protein n=1 Tax=Gossypium schwendimanii TaxID=34291 RepID=A0A7J9N7V7_GOSSC|nr:hypothetical protein [Gossypium schwendimanii]